MLGIIIVVLSIAAAAYLIYKKILCTRCTAFCRPHYARDRHLYFARSSDYGEEGDAPRGA